MTIEAKTIQLKGVGIQEEAVANAAGILPGHLIQVMSTGKVRVHPVAGGSCEKLFAIEDELQGKGISETYAADARLQYVVGTRGMWINAQIKDGENIAIGDPLESAGNGELQKHTPDDSTSSNHTDQIVGYAMAACDMSGSSAVDPSGRCAVRVA